MWQKMIIVIYRDLFHQPVMAEYRVAKTIIYNLEKFLCALTSAPKSFFHTPSNEIALHLDDKIIECNTQEFFAYASDLACNTEEFFAYASDFAWINLEK